MVLLTVLLIVPPTAHVQAAQVLPVETLLNPDGTLNTSTGASGVVDLRGWNITLDSARGPVFQPAGAPQAMPALQGTTWSALGTGMNDHVYAIAISGSGDVYAGGNFTSAGTCTSDCNYIAKWNGSSWSALGTGMDMYVFALAVSGSDVYAGGAFNSAGGVADTAYIAKWNGTSWSALGTGMDFNVNALAVSGTGDVYAGGAFNSAGGVARTRKIAKWNGASWSALGRGMDFDVNALAISGSDVYAGGDFNSAGGVANTSRIAKWNGTTWSGLGTGMDGEVKAIAVSGSDVYAGGEFTRAGTCTYWNGCRFIAKWNGTSWSALGTGMDIPVWALAISGSGDVYAGGYFTSAGTCTSNCNRIAKWNGSSWSALGSGMNGIVLAIAISGSNVYAGGTFTTAGGTAANYIAKYGAAPTDTTPPVITPTITPAPNAGWNNTNVTVSWSVSDPESGIASSSGCTAPTSLTTDTPGTTLTCSATNGAGLSSSKSVTIKIDKTAPTITGSRTPAANANGWNNSDVTVSFTCTDALSGVATASGPTTLSSNGSNQSVTGTCTDNAGNSASAPVGNINIDKTAPTLACSIKPNSLWPPNHKLEQVNASVNVADSLSGSAGFTLLAVTSNEPDNGLGDGDTANDIQGFVIGTASTSGQLRAERSGTGTGRVYTLNYKGMDKAGNTANCTVTVTVPLSMGNGK